jgi:hypothetical protein
MIETLAAVGQAMQVEYMGGLSAARRTALIHDLLHIKSNLLRMVADAGRSS